MVQTTEEKLVENIQKLQEIEKKLYKNLEVSIANKKSSTNKNLIIAEINRIAELRINLYKTLSNLNGNYFSNLDETADVLGEQTIALSIVERELNENKNKLEEINQDNINKMRMVQINTYYGKRFEEHTYLMKVLLYTFVPVLILSFLFFKGWLPSMVYYVLIVIIGLIGFYYVWITIVSIMSRDKMNYEEYDWFFNSSKAPNEDNLKVNIKSPWESLDVTTCIGQECCLPGYVFDSDNNKCTLTRENMTNMGSTNQIKNMDEEEYKVLTKYANTNKKPDVVMNSRVMPTYSSSNISSDDYESAYDVR